MNWFYSPQIIKIIEKYEKTNWNSWWQLVFKWRNARASWINRVTAPVRLTWGPANKGPDTIPYCCQWRTQRAIPIKLSQTEQLQSKARYVKEERKTQDYVNHLSLSFWLAPHRIHDPSRMSFSRQRLGYKTPFSSVYSSLIPGRAHDSDEVSWIER